MLCDICGGKRARKRKINEIYGEGKNMFVIEKIPMVSCPDCKESYFTAKTLHEIERLKLHKRTLAVQKPVNVLRFA